MLESRIKNIMEITGESEEEVLRNMIRDREKEIRELVKEKQWLLRYQQTKLERESA